MRFLLDNVDLSSRSGPNGFGLKLARALSYRGHQLVDSDERPDVQLSFIQQLCDAVPMVLRLDGIWFNSMHDWRAQNEPIHRAYDAARAVVIQSEFDRELVQRYFGARDDTHVIHNGTDIEFVCSVDPMSAPSLHDVEHVWSCAAAWRPHKRLSENVRYFREHAGPLDCLIIAGANPDLKVSDPRVFYAGDLDYETLVSLYRASDYFLHLAWLDHSPNTVVDARAAGCHIVCSSSGGTEEIAGLNSTVIEEDEWDFQPCKLYEPLQLDFSRKRQGRYESEIDIDIVASMYESVLIGAL